MAGPKTMNTVKSLLARFTAGEFDIHSASEAAFKSHWLGIPSDSNPFEAAFHGGLLADRLAWVFLAAYQGAIRDCFNGLPKRAWVSFAVSEDRSGKVPGTKIDEQRRLSGTKTWVAAVDHVDYLIVTPGLSVAHGCLLIEANSPEVLLTARQPADFLSDMSQGSATFNQFPLLAEHTITDHTAQHFGLAEAFFVLVAGCGFLLKETGRMHATTLQGRLIKHLQDLEQCYAGNYKGDGNLLLALYETGSNIGRECAALVLNAETSNQDWRANGKLLGMYGRSLRNNVNRP